MSKQTSSQILQTATENSTGAPSGILQRKCACGTHTVAGDKCDKCKNKNKILQRKSSNSSKHLEVPPIVHQVLRSSGQPLDAATRGFFEPRFGRDFSGVRVHTNMNAAKSAGAINAHAYTAGNNIVFGLGHYQPETNAGKRLLAHELTHVLQQKDGIGSTTSKIVPENHSSEFEADRVASQVMESSAGRRGAISTGNAIGVHRDVAPVPVTPQQINQLHMLFQEFNTLARTGAIAAEEAAAISTAVAEAEAAVVIATEVAAAGATATAVGEGALATSAALAADDVTGIGVADDVAIPFVLLGAAAAFGIGYLIGSSASEIAAAWRRASDAVGRAIDAIRRAISRARRPEIRESGTQTQTQAQPQTQTQTQAGSQTEEQRRCQETHPTYLTCTDQRTKEKVATSFAKSRGITVTSIECWGETSFGAGTILDCGMAPGESWHCRINNSDFVVSLFGCLCCKADGTVGYEWRPHQSSGQEGNRTERRRDPNRQDRRDRSDRDRQKRERRESSEDD